MGIQVTVLTLAVFLVYKLLPGGEQIPTPVFWTLWVFAALAALVTAVLDWERMFSTGAARVALYAWSAVNILLVTVLIAFSSEDAHSLFFLYVLTTLFFSLALPVRHQVIVFAFTVACNVALYAMGEMAVSPADFVLRIGLLGGVAALAGFSTTQLMSGISGLTRRKDEIEDEKSLYKSLIEAQSGMGQGVCIYEMASGRFLYANDALCKTLGYTHEELLTKTYMDVLSPESQEQAAAAREQRAQGIEPKYPRDATAMRKDGTPFIVELVTKPLDPGRLITVSRDVTEDRQAHQNRVELLKAISELTSDYAYSLRLHPDFTSSWEWVTDGFSHITGYTPEAAEEMGGWPALLHPDDVEQSMATFEDLLAAPGRSAVSELRILTRSGEPRWLRTFARTVWDDEEGRAVRLYGAVRDITDSKEAEDALKASEQRYRSLFERVAVGLFLRTPDGIGLDANPACIAMYGYPDRETFVATPAERLYADPADRDRWLEQIESGSTEGFEVEMRKYDGSTFWARLTGLAVRGPDGSTQFLEGGVEDVTERRQLEDQLRQAQKMEAVGRLAGGIAHDFNNLLTAIIGYSELLMDDPDLSERTKADVQEIDQAAQMGADIASQLLDLSRRRVLKAEVLDLNEVIATMEPMLRRLIGDDIVLEADLAKGGCRVEADRSQLEQVVLNLVVNARDALPDGGEVCIRTRPVELSEAEAARSLRLRPGRHAILSVGDTGNGIPPEVKDRIFEPFFTTRPGGRSTGLGLSTVYGIVSQYNGHIEVASQVDKGSTFSVYLPEATPQPTVMARVRAAERWLSGDESILLVEDDDSVRKLARRALEQYGYKVVEASGGRQALDLLADGMVIDLVVTDVVMSGMSGRQLARNLIEKHPDLKILYMSGYTGEALERTGDLMSNEDFIAKPYRPDALVSKVRELLNRGQPRVETKS